MKKQFMHKKLKTLWFHFDITCILKCTSKIHEPISTKKSCVMLLFFTLQLMFLVPIVNQKAKQKHLRCKKARPSQKNHLAYSYIRLKSVISCGGQGSSCLQVAMQDRLHKQLHMYYTCMSILAINYTLMCKSLSIISLSLGYLSCSYSWLLLKRWSSDKLIMLKLLHIKV